MTNKQASDTANDAAQELRKRRLAAVIKSHREHTGLTQKEAAMAARQQDGYVSSIEAARLQLIYPDPFNALRRVLGFKGYEVLEAMGFETDATNGGHISPTLHALIASMDDEQQLALVDVIRGMNRYGGASGRQVSVDAQG